MCDWVPSPFTWNYHSIVNRIHPNTKQKVQKKKVLILGCCFSVILFPIGSGIWTRDLHFYPQEIWCMTPPISPWETVLWRMRVCMLSLFSYVWLCATLWTIAHQAPLSMGFSRQEYRSGLLCRPPGDLPEPGIELESLTSPALQVGSTSATWEAWLGEYVHLYEGWRVWCMQCPGWHWEVHTGTDDSGVLWAGSWGLRGECRSMLLR